VRTELTGLNFLFQIKVRGGCPADWVWIVPPMSGSATPVFHQVRLKASSRLQAKKIEKAASFLPLGLPSKLIKGASQKRLSNHRILKRFCVEGI